MKDLPPGFHRMNEDLVNAQFPPEVQPVQVRHPLFHCSFCIACHAIASGDTHCTNCTSTRPGQMKVLMMPGLSWCPHQRAALTGRRPAPQEIMHILQAATRQPDAAGTSGYC